MKRFFTQLSVVAAIVAAAPTYIIAAEYVAPVSVAPYTMSALAKVAASGVTEIEPGVYAMAKDVTISAGNTFSLSGTKTIKMADGVRLTINCSPDLQPASRVTITRASDQDKPQGIVIDYDATAIEPNVKASNIDFEYVALRNSGSTGLDVDNCSFSYANGALNSVAALSIGNTNVTYNVTNCRFTQCTVPAIAGAANYYCGLNIKGCTFTDNNSSNTNKPQLNLTVGGSLPVVIDDCVFEGAGRDKVGAIGVGNLLAANADNKVYISNCDIRDHRYGITGTGPMYMEIRDCVIVDNNHETNPMQGGSGISLAGYNYGLDAVVSGCHIENSLWGITLVQCRNVTLGEVGNPASPGNNVFVNNGNGGVPYDLYNNGTTDVMAQNNTWSVPEQTEANIETVIFHKPDNDKLGLVTFMPAKDKAGINGIPAAPTTLTFDGKTVSAPGPIKVYSITGQLLASTASQAFDASALAPGIYIARCGNSAIKFTKR